MPFRKMERDIELVKAVSLTLEAQSLSLPMMRSILTMLEKNASHAKVEIVKSYDWKGITGQSEIFLNYDGKVPLEVLRLVGNKLFDKKNKLNSYDTYGVQLVGFERLLIKAELHGVDNKGYEKIYSTVADELARQMIDEYLKAHGMMVRN
ncbi:MAG: hypothetical protein KGH71_05240 [Candidatus Micrarchaeota archaeon]|nr:hypothetical protein [Candidatus Micrarchaeota archaeon]